VSWKDAGGRRGFGDHVSRLGDERVAELLASAH